MVFLRKKRKAVWLELGKKVGMVGMGLIEERRTGLHVACKPG